MCSNYKSLIHLFSSSSNARASGYTTFLAFGVGGEIPINILRLNAETGSLLPAPCRTGNANPSLFRNVLCSVSPALLLSLYLGLDPSFTLCSNWRKRFR